MYDVAILGSCVTRDAAPFFPPDWHLCTYTARQSWISIERPCLDPLLHAHHFPSAFQDRMFHGDLQGNAIEVLEEFASRSQRRLRLILIDLIDERNGVYVKSPTEVITRSYEGNNAGLYSQLLSGWSHLAFGSLMHQHMFTESAELFKSRLQQLGMWETTRIIGATWAETDQVGSECPPSAGFPSQTANELLTEYYGYLRSEGWVVATPEAIPVAHSDHKWGTAPFHYQDAYYQSAIREVQRTLT